MPNKPPPPPPRKAEAEKSSRRLQVWVTPGLHQEITNRAELKGTGWSVSKECEQLLRKALEGEAATPKRERSEVELVREIMRDRGVGEGTARMLLEAERAAAAPG